ncbi:AmmeMemoRadiSam system protein B [Geobacter sp. SVR]|uniref:AmmeMemoRadiSam system protein B n=1 Tax=Geobacter sp. SVR TaxID=2495594 RepID=UPI00143F0088|nr:AmmeMemoRadiSam system protein B [Geobacter sp. SVR]BCS53978.1 MEMO1 family protein [Geobacter sp. SVR]GCF86241.1 MEMO1 family protein [Geobacter sp. SVR]
MLRPPAVAGQFYPGTPEKLRNDLENLLVRSDRPDKVLGIMAPHAGYLYSGAIAGAVYGGIEIPATVLIIGPNHHGAGKPAALFPDGQWQTPLGPVPLDSRLNALILQHIPLVQTDTQAHRQEHSLEVQLPFLQMLRPDVSIAALCLGYGDFSVLEEIGRGLASAITAFGGDVLIVASSDMSHYESAASARAKDGLALERITAFDPEGLLRVCRTERITMCGVVPAAIMMVAAARLGATRAQVIAYGTSGDVTGDDRQVVGYAAVTVS